MRLTKAKIRLAEFALSAIGVDLDEFAAYLDARELHKDFMAGREEIYGHDTFKDYIESCRDGEVVSALGGEVLENAELYVNYFTPSGQVPE